jgi:hypothetical protein
MKRRIVSFLLTVLTMLTTTAATAAVKQPGNFFVDEATWYKQLISARPSLLSKGRELDEAVMLNPHFRSLMLVSPNSVGSIMSQYYSGAQQETDKRWIASQQQAWTALGESLQQQFKSLNRHGTSEQYKEWLTGQNIVKPTGGDSYYVNYIVGPGLEVEKGGYRVYFTFSDVDAQLSPADYQGFAQALLRSGFAGDVRTESFAGGSFMHYDHISVRSNNIAAAKLAEAVGRAFFGGKISHIGHGFDVGAEDWHQYLIRNSGSVKGLPADTQAFVEYDN